MNEPQHVFQSDDVSVKVRDVRVVDGQRDVVSEEVDNIIVPFQHLKD